MLRAVPLLAAAAIPSTAETYFKEDFSDADWEKRWVRSDWKKDEDKRGEWVWTSGKWHVDAAIEKGIQTTQDMHFHAISAKLPKAFSNEGKDLVVQFTAKHEDHKYGFCGGGYIKLLGSGLDQSKFGGDSEYSIMFGPDLCSYDVERIHLIFNNKETGINQKNLAKKEEIKMAYDDKNEFTHLYTLVLKPDNSYAVYFDEKEKASGKITGDWEFPGETIRDPEDPLKVPDPEAEKPEEWDEDVDGEFETPLIENPTPKMIPNPNYNSNQYLYSDIGAVGFELWTVNNGTIFDNIYVGTSHDEAKEVAKATWAKIKDGEKEAKEKWEKKDGKKDEL